MSKESKIIIDMINNQKQIDASKIRDEMEKKEKKADEEQRKKEYFLKRSEEVMGKLGVVEIFEELRDTGFLRYSNKPLSGKRNTIFGEKWAITKPYTPARIEFSDNSVAVSIKFDENYDGCSENWYPKTVSVSQSENNEIIIEGYSIRSYSADVKFRETTFSREEIPVLIGNAILSVRKK